MSDSTGPPRSDSRPARREAFVAALMWFAALVLTVGLSTWLDSMPGASVLGVPRWAAYGVLVPWAVFFVLHIRFCLDSGADKSKS
ncbi:MAG: hypothetical protein OXC19_13705 [Bryobacterales bacterium]|nr:hypothetical protein [Bryobacterales bacterium]